MTKPAYWHVRPAKTQISLGIRPVWSESSLCAQRVAKDPGFLHADSEDSVQTGRMPRLICVFAGRTCHFVGFVTRRLNSQTLPHLSITLQALHTKTIHSTARCFGPWIFLLQIGENTKLGKMKSDIDWERDRNLASQERQEIPWVTTTTEQSSYLKLPEHRYSFGICTFSGPTLVFGKIVSLNPGLGGVRDVASHLNCLSTEPAVFNLWMLYSKDHLWRWCVR